MPQEECKGGFIGILVCCSTRERIQVTCALARSHRRVGWFLKWDKGGGRSLTQATGLALGVCPPPWWCCVPGSCTVPCFCSWHCRSGSWSGAFCILFLIACQCSYFQSLGGFFVLCCSRRCLSRCKCLGWGSRYQHFIMASCSENVTIAQRKNEGEGGKNWNSMQKVFTVFRSHN